MDVASVSSSIFSCKEIHGIEARILRIVIDNALRQHLDALYGMLFSNAYVGRLFRAREALKPLQDTLIHAGW